jgi:AhpD family alkylhydroperoxidase
MVNDPMRLNPYVVRPKAYRALSALVHEVEQGPLEPALRCLIELRVSQLNRCGFCLAMHADGARDAGVPQEKLDTIAGWRDDDQFTDRERLALELAEALTSASDLGVSDDLWTQAAAQFTEAELADLLYLNSMMNHFNRLNVASQIPARQWRDRRAKLGTGDSP